MSEILSELFTMTFRAAKGITILFFIYGSAAFFCCLLVTVLTQEHLDAEYGTDSQHDAIEERKDRLK